MNLQQYQQMLEKHDWYYSFSEDGRIYDRGLAEEKELKKLAENNPSFEEAYQNKFNKLFKKQKDGS